MTYNWQLADWPDFSYNIKELEPNLFEYARLTGRLAGKLESLDSALQTDALIEFMVNEALKTSKIEGENLEFNDVKSSIRNQLGLNKPLKPVNDFRAKGIAQMMLDVRNSAKKPLTKERLFDWHRMLFLDETPWDSLKVGSWRTHQDPMQIVSGPYGKWTIHFEAPPSGRIPSEMERFLTWFNQPATHAPIRAAIAHLYFESIHPFEDGNGRIGRAIAEKALLGQAPFVAVLNLSTAIEKRKKDYYEALKKAQRSNEITPWLLYFTNMLLEAQNMAEASIQFILTKTNLIKLAEKQVTGRQLKVLKRMLQEGPAGFAGGINAKKYEAIGQCSKATATRELSDLLEKGFLKKLPGRGRNTAYNLVI